MMPPILELTSDVKHVVKARTGVAVHSEKGDILTIINTPGTQVVDAWAVTPEDPAHHMSMAAFHASTSRLSPRVDDTLLTNKCVPILQVVRDTSPGLHDTLISACHIERYHLLGVPPDQYHENCSDNFHSALAKLSPPLPSNFPTPAPLNLFMNIPLKQTSGTDISGVELAWEPCTCKPGDFISLRCLLTCVVVISACPNDVTKINSHEPKDIEFMTQTGPS